MGRHGWLGIPTRQRRSPASVRPCRPLGAPYIVPPRRWNSPGRIIYPNATQTSWISAAGRHSPHFEYISFFKSVYNLTDAWRIVQETDDPDSTIILDAFHNWNSNSTLDDLRAIPLEKISHYHIDDAHPDIACTEQKDPDRVMLGKVRSISPPNWPC